MARKAGPLKLLLAAAAAAAGIIIARKSRREHCSLQLRRNGAARFAAALRGRDNSYK
jgi:hypothetical protein